MFDVSKIQTALNGVVGFRQPDNPDYAILDAPNQVSRSGRYVTDNPYVKIEYLLDNQDYSAVDAAAFNANLQNLQNSSISEVAGWVFDKTDFIDRQLLFRNPHNKVNTVTLPSGLACYKICVDGTKNIAFEIKRVFLDFEGTGQLTLMLFNSAKKAPIYTTDIAIANEENKEVQLNWVVDNTDGYYKGEFYLGWLTNDVDLGTLKPYDRDYNDADVMSTITYLNVQRILFPGHAVEELPNLEDDDGLSDNIGVNPDITVYEDYTDLIIQNERMFQHAIYLQLCIKCIEIYLASLRSNDKERKSQERILRVIQQIEGQSGEGLVKIEGLKPNLLTELAKVRKEINRIRDGYFTSEITTETLY